MDAEIFRLETKSVNQVLENALCLSQKVTEIDNLEKALSALQDGLCKLCDSEAVNLRSLQDLKTKFFEVKDPISTSNFDQKSAENQSLDHLRQLSGQKTAEIHEIGKLLDE